MSTDGLLCGDVMDICPCDSESALLSWAAGGTRAFLIDRSEVLGEYRIAQIQCSRGDDGIAKALVAGE